ncbi:copper transporter [Dietzia sp. 179-F 9C3 NHS]|uniref:copper transporter n=1 Tax=Dietzia sp. 179-F 9C3 NHS TaxID=3374295 RepID=UPI003879FFBB
MISLRRHVLTLVAVFLALAIGVLLGSTSVASSVRDAVVDREETTAARLETTESDLAEAHRDVDRLDGLAATVAHKVVDGRLRDRPVLVVVAPGAQDRDVRAAVDMIGRAGGVDAGRLTLADRAFDPAVDAELEALVANLPIGTAPAADADLGTKLGTALGRAGLLRTEDAQPHLSDEDRGAVLRTLADAGMVEFERGTIRPGQLTLVVTGPVEQESVAVRVAALTRALDREGAGAVLGAELGGGGDPDAVSVLRSSGDDTVSTVDNVGADAGRLATALALADQLDRKQGHYGMRDDATSAIPAVSP